MAQMTVEMLRKVANKGCDIIFIHKNRVVDLVKESQKNGIPDFDPCCDRELIKRGFIGRISDQVVSATGININIIRGVNTTFVECYDYDIEKDRFLTIEEILSIGTDFQKDEPEKDHTGMIQNPIDGIWKFF